MKFDNVALYKPSGGKTYCFKIPNWAKPTKRHFNTHQAIKKEAERVREEYLTQCQSQVSNQTYEKAFLDRAIETYLEAKRYLAETSFKKYKQTVFEFKDFVISKLGKIPKIQEIEKPLIEAYLQSILDNGKSTQTRNDKRNIITNLFGYAVNNRWGITNNPVSKIAKINETESEHPEPLNQVEVKTLLDYLKRLNLQDKKYRCKCYYEIMAVVYYAGLRISEVTHLFKTDVDYKIDIRNKTLPKEYSGKVSKDGQPIPKEYRTKTKRNWEAPIVPELEEILKHWLVKVKDNLSPLLFPNLNGCPIDTDDIYRVVKKALVKLGFPPDKINRPLHRGRHTFTSISRQKVEEALVQQALGHKSNIMTRHYTHLTPEYIRNKFKGLSYGQGKKGKV